MAWARAPRCIYVALVLVDLDQFVTLAKFSKNYLVNLGLGIWPNLIGKRTQPKFRGAPKPVLYFWPVWALEKTVFGCTGGQFLDISENCTIFCTCSHSTHVWIGLRAPRPFQRAIKQLGSPNIRVNVTWPYLIPVPDQSQSRRSGR